jgi:ribosomal protein S1
VSQQLVRRRRAKSVRAFTQEEWDALITAYPPGTPVSGEVVSRQVFGVFVRIDQFPEVTALLEIVHFGLLVADPQHRIQFPADYPAVGIRIKARVLAWCLKPKDVRLTQLTHLDWSHDP